MLSAYAISILATIGILKNVSIFQIVFCAFITTQVVQSLSAIISGKKES